MVNTKDIPELNIETYEPILGQTFLLYFYEIVDNLTECVQFGTV